MNALDMLIVGGGPAGTAAAFRARELGLEALVLEYDDLMKRIRDYCKDKLILPSFGGGDRMGFPVGGSLISALHFEPIDKDDMCASWKGLYREHGIATRIGVEFTGMERRQDGDWEVRAWDHGQRREETLLAKTVVLALGRGVPRRFDIPGNTEGIAYKLTDPLLYVGAPSCVIGGGNSAAEAVIAISNAKAEAGDPTAVYWSYRGDKMPRVSKALADEFFEAYVGRGNIRYHPRSEPVAVTTAEDRNEYLAVRVDRRRLEGRPSETSHLEFAKERCLACIGEDIPEAMLASLGTPLVQGGPKRRRRAAVTRWLETRQPNVFLAGDLLSHAYFEVDDFDADPAGFREVKHRGNVKSALRDGVLVAEVIAQKCAGRSEIDVRIEETVEPAPERSLVGLVHPVESGGPPPESEEPERRISMSEAFLVRVLPTGVEEDEFPLRQNGVTSIGRAGCDITLPNDSMMAPRHCSISHNEEGYLLRDDGSPSGVFLQVPPARKLEIGDRDLIRAGRQFLLFSIGGGESSFTHYDHTGREVGRHDLPARPAILGRRAPDLTLDPKDTILSRRHLALSREGEKVLLKDLKSVNGTYLRVRSGTRLRHGDRFRAGQQLFTFSLKEGEPLDSGHEPVAPAAPVEAAVRPAAEGVRVSFRGVEQSFPLRPDQTICELAEEQGLELTAECHSGICGSDPVRILSGREHVLGEAGDQERETLEELCELEPGECRLACMLRVKGPVEIEILRPDPD